MPDSTKNDILGNLRSTVKQNTDNTSGTINPQKSDILGNIFGSSIDRSGYQQRDLSKYTDYIVNPTVSPNVDLDQMRAVNQSNWDQLGNATLGGLASGLATAVEAISYLNPHDLVYGTFLKADDYERNAIASAMTDLKEYINEELPIYRENPDKVFDTGDFAFYMDAWKSIIDSAVGFGAPGLGVVKGMNILGKGISALKFAQKSEAVFNFLNQSKKMADLYKGISAAYLTNHMEGMVMATESYANMLQEYDADMAKDDSDPTKKYQNVDKDTFKNLAAQKAYNFTIYNKLFIATNYLELGAIFRNTGTTTASLGKTFVKQQLLNAPVESFEELGQGVFQKYSEDDVRKELGIKENYQGTNFIEKAIEILKDPQVQLEGLLGAFGGPFQYSIMSLPFDIANRKAQKALRESQDQVLADSKTYAENIGKNTLFATTLEQEARNKGNTEEADAINKMNFVNIAARNLQFGTEEQFINILEDKINTAESEQDKKVAQDALSRFKDMQDTWEKLNGKYLNAEELFSLGEQISTLKDFIDKNKDLSIANKKEVLDNLLKNNQIQDIEMSLGRILISNRNLGINLDEQGNLNIDEKLDFDQKGTDINSLINSIKEQYNSAISLDPSINHLQTNEVLLNKLQDKYSSLTSFAHQKKLYTEHKNNKEDYKLIQRADKIEDISELERLRDTLKTDSAKEYIESKINELKAKANNQQVDDTTPTEEAFKPKVDNKPDDSTEQPAESDPDKDIFDELTAQANEELAADKKTLEEQSTTSNQSEIEAKKAASTNEVTLDNIQQIIIEGSGRLEVSIDGNKVEFEYFDIAIDRENKTAEVEFVRKKDPTKNKGVGYKAYIELGRILAENGITLESKGQAQYRNGKDLWDKLVREGYATGNKGRYTFNKERVSPKESTESITTESLLAGETIDIATKLEEPTVDIPIPSTEENVPNVNESKELRVGAYNTILYRDIIDGEVNPDAKELLRNDRYWIDNEIELRVDSTYEDGVDNSQSNTKSKGFTANKDNVNTIPIVIIDKSTGIRLGFIKTIDSIKDEAEKQALLKVRQHIKDSFEKGQPVYTKIIEVKNKLRDDKLENRSKLKRPTPISRAWGNSIHIGFINTDKEIVTYYDKDSNRKELPFSKLDPADNPKKSRDGNHVGVEQVTIDSKGNPVLRLVHADSVTLKEEYVNSIFNAIYIWATQDKELAAKVKKDSSSHGYGFNFLSRDDLYNYLSLFVNLRTSEDFDAIKNTTYANGIIHFSGNEIKLSIPLMGTNASFSVSKNSFKSKALTNSSKKAISRILSSTYFSMNTSAVGTTIHNVPNISITQSNDKLDVTTENFNKSSSYVTWVKDNLVTTTRAFNIGTKENPQGRLFIHPTFVFDTNFNSNEVNVPNPSSIVNKQSNEKVNQEEREQEMLDPNSRSKTDDSAPTISPKAQSIKDKYSKSKNINNSLNGGINLSLPFKDKSILNKALEKELFNNIKTAKVFRAIVDGTYRKRLKEIIQNKDNRSIDEVLYDYKKILLDQLTSERIDLTDFVNEGGDLADPEFYNELKGFIETKEEILSKFDQIEQKVIDRLASDQQLTRDDSSQYDSSDDIKVDNDGVEDESGERVSYSSIDAFTVDSKTKISTELKLLLKTIDSENVDLFGDPELIPFDEVYNTLHMLLNDVDANFDTMIYALEQYGSITKYQWVKNVVSALKSSKDHVKAGFVTDMAKHKIVMPFMQYSKVPQFKDGKIDSYIWQFKILTDNSNDDALLIKMQWESNLLNSDLFNTDLTLNQDYFATVNELYNNAFKYKNGTKEEIIESMGALLTSLGIYVPDIAFNAIYDYGIGKINGKAILVGKHSILNAVKIEILDKVKNPNFDIDVFEPLNKSDFLKLAGVASMYSSRWFSNSFKSGIKTLYAFTNNRFLNLRLRELKGKFTTNSEGEAIFNPSELGLNLSQTVFSRHSYLLKELNNPNSILNTSSDTSLFSIQYASLNILKKLKSRNRDNQQLRKLSEGEHETSQLAAFTADSSSRDSVINETTDGIVYQRRKAVFFMPTHSDKEIMPMMKYYGFKLKYDENFNLDQNTLQLLYNNVVLPEIDRIQNITYNKSVLNFDSIEADLFYYIPELNEWIPNGADSTYLNLIKQNKHEEYIDQVFNILQQRVDKEVKTKLNFWKENNIAQVSKAENGATNSYTYLDNDYVKSLKNTYGTDINVTTLAATDMVVNYMLFNSAITSVFNGDIAPFFKSDYKSYEKYLSDNKLEDNIENRQNYKILQVSDTYTNLGKRLASLVAPGNQPELYNKQSDNEYIQLFFNNADRSVTDEYKATLRYLFGKDSAYMKEYLSVDPTDAQEYRTWKSHLNYLRRFGKISNEKYEELYDKIESNKTLTIEDLKDIFQPLKPVYADSLFEELPNGLKIQRYIYIKTSSFPLIPQLTSTNTIDNLRIAMESIEEDKGKDVAAVFKSGTKVGFPSNAISVREDKDINFKSASDILQSIENSQGRTMLTLNYKGLRNQLETPSKASPKTNDGTQQRKLIFANILDVKFRNGKTGRQLLDQYESAYKKLYSIHKKDIESQLLDSEGNLKIEEVAKLLQEEARSRNYDLSDLKFLELVKKEDGTYDFAIPLEFNSSSSKFQSLVNSIVKNRVTKIKMPGYSYYLGSEAGFGINTDPNAAKEYEDQIVYLKKRVVDNKGNSSYIPSWDKKELQPMRYALDKNGNPIANKVLPAQILVQPRFMFNGTYINMMDYAELDTTDSKYYIDSSKIDPELLKMFGFRIPTQGLSSMASIEIVGFLPTTAGDLVIAPMQWTKQMGSDFDIDKLYSYFYNLYIKDGKINKVTNDLDIKDVFSDALRIKNRVTRDAKKIDSKFSISENGVASSSQLFNTILENMGFTKDDIKVDPKKLDIWKLQNEIIDIHHTILTEGNKDVQKQIHSPLLFDSLKVEKSSNSYSNEDKDLERVVNSSGGVANAINNKRFNSDIPSILSQTYQRTKYTNANAASITIGAVALDSTLHIVSQKLYHDKTPLSLDDDLSFGQVNTGDVMNGILGGKFTYDESTYISNVLSAFLSSGLDNEKEAILEKINLNNHTLDAFRAMAMVGYTSDIIGAFLSQDVVLEYVSKVAKAKSQLAEYNRNAEKDIIEQLYLKYAKSDNLETIQGVTSEGLKYFSDTPNTFKALFDLVALPSKDLSFGSKQTAILSKFLQFTASGKKIKSVQSAINSDSKFVPKSIIGSIEKEKNIIGLIESNIANAHKLIGDYISLKDDDTYRDLTQNELDMGFVQVSKSIAINPTTVSGFASVYGVIFNNQLFAKRLFPISTSPLFDYIAEQFTRELPTDVVENMSANKKEELKVDILQDLKSFLYSQDEAFNQNADTRRKELLDPENGLSKIIDEIKANYPTYFNNNRFLNKLTKGTLINQLSSTKETRVYYKQNPVNFNAAPSVNLHEDDLYDDFLRLFADDTNILTREITPFKLGEMLIEYAYAIGGIQEAREYVKYLPADVIKGLNLPIYLTKNTDQFVLDKTIGTKTNRSYPTEFTIQRMQHEPSLAQILDNKLYTFNGSKLSISPEGYEQLVSPTGNPYKWFIAIQGKNKADLRLFIFNPKDKQYTEIATKGQSNIKEYSNSFRNKSMFNNDLNSVISDSFPTTLDTQDGNEYTNPLVSNSYKTVDKGNKQYIKYFLNKFKDSNNPYYRKLIPVILNNLDKLPSNLQIRFIPPTDRPELSEALGAYIPSYLSEDKLPTIYVNKELNPTNELFEETMLHEIFHTFSRELIKKSKSTTLSTETAKAIGDINRLYLRYKNFVKAEYNITDEYLNNLNNKNLLESTETPDKLVYAAVSLDEFISHSISNPTVMQYMQGKESGFFNKLIDSIVNALKKWLGISTDDNLLTSTIASVIHTIDVASEAEISSIDQKTAVESSDLNTQYSQESLNMSIAEFLRTLPEDERRFVRDMINNKQLKTKCK